LTDDPSSNKLAFVDPDSGLLLAHGLSDGDRVIYHVRSGDDLRAMAIGGLQDGRVYRVVRINATTIQLKFNDVTIKEVDFVRRASGGDQIIRIDGTSWSSNGFDAGQELLIQTPSTGGGSSLNNGTYHFQAVAGATLTLATTDPRVTATRIVAPVVFFQFLESVSCGSGCTTTITHNRIQRTDGTSWTTNTNFANGQDFLVSGTTSNNVTYTIANVLTTTSTNDTLEVDETITAETDLSATFSNKVRKQFDEDVIVLSPQKASIKTGITFGGNESATTMERSTGWENLAVGVGSKITIAGTADTDGDPVRNDGTYKVTAINVARTIITAMRCADSSCATLSTTDIVPGLRTASINVVTAATEVESATVRFVRNDAGDLIIRDDGVSWLTDTSFGPNSQINIGGAGANNGFYTVKTATATTLTLMDTNRVKATEVTTNLAFTHVASGVDRIRRTDSLLWTATTNLIVGSTITITGAGANNGTYVITEITSDTIGVDSAVSASTVTATVASGALAKTLTQTNPHKAGDDLHSLIRDGDSPLRYTDGGGGTLVDGQTYYVVNPGGSSTTIGIALSRGGPALTFDTTGLRLDASHSFEPTIDLTSPADGTHQLRIDVLASPALSGNQKITGQGGLPLGSLLTGSGNGLSKVKSTGSGGGFVGVGTNDATVTADPNVSAHISTGTSGSVTAGGSVTITTSAMTNINADSRNDTGGFVGISDADATASSTVRSEAYIDQDVRLVAGGDLTMLASSDITANSATRSRSGGFVGSADANSQVTTNYTTLATIKMNADIAVAGRASLSTNARADGDGNAYASGIGAGGDGDSRNGVTAGTSRSEVELGTDVSLVAKSASLKA